MPTQVRLFISAGPAEEAARELLGQALAELPVNVGWTIKRTPDVDSVAECHIFLILMGADIVAPVGLELWWARRTDKPVFAYAAATMRTPAGQVFLQENSRLEWRRFADAAGLRRAVLRDLASFLLQHTERYGLTVLEIEALRGLLAGLDVTRPEKAPAKASGAAGGGVILAPGKDEPAGARLIGNDRP
jgi:hypothetical protein